MKAKISIFKAKLSAYVAAVRKGETVVVFDRDTPVAKLVPIEQPNQMQVVREATVPIAQIFSRKSKVRLKHPVDVVALLREDRDKR